ncbi:peptidase s8 and s53 subtilisin kexin sedolisin [Fusarium sporotrichioides]|uniref:Peptidase s8 and s53 subtilisin kexin sedolisin n=1 Tax=Fusarium sporotrichioides TaxID=5514 RepID=A0A395SCW5_FUSSP|nr:peptidase s8 and s53 subtilisin kexin sedolisin [Fusarium sporotrichioides]
MKWQSLLALSSIVQAAAGLKLIDESEDNGVVCYTYLSTYLAAVDIETAGPAPIFPTTRGILPPYFTNRSTSAVPPSTFPADRESSTLLQDPESTVALLTSSDFVIPTQSSELFSSTATISSQVSTTSSQSEVTGQPVIFFVTPNTANKRRSLVKRVTPGGFIDGASSADICTDAAIFQLADGQLLDNGSPIYYDGEPYKQFGSDGTPPDGAITREFANVNGNLVFASNSLPSTNAGFCQDDSGRVYITFGSGPSGCDPVLLQVYTGNRTMSKWRNNLARSIELYQQRDNSVSCHRVDRLFAESTNASTSSDISPVVTETQSIDTTEEAATVTADLSSTSAPSLSSPTISPIASQSVSLFPTSSSADSTVTAASTDVSSSSESSLESSSSTVLSTDSTVTTDGTFTETSTEETTASISTATLTEESETSTQLETTTTAEEATTTATTTVEETTTTAEETTTTAEETTTIATTTTGCDSVVALTTVALPNPTPIFTDNLDHDDDFVAIALPFNVANSGQSTVYVSTNGVLSVGSGADAFNNEGLPSTDLPSVAICAYWDDLYLKRSRGDTIVYEVFDGQNGMQATFEWVIGRFANTGPFHFTATIYEDYPDVFRFRYYTTPEKGSSATTGAQNRDSGKTNQVSFNDAGSVQDGTSVYISINGITQIGPFDNTECGKAGTSDNSSLFAD